MSHLDPASDDILRVRVAWLVAVVLLGYPLGGTLVALTSLPSLVASVPVRLTALLLSLSLLLSFDRSRPLRVALRVRPLSLTRAALLAFWALYVGRLAWDWQVADVPGAASALVYLLVAGIGPAAGLLAIGPQHWDVRRRPAASTPQPGRR